MKLVKTAALIALVAVVSGSLFACEGTGADTSEATEGVTEAVTTEELTEAATTAEPTVYYVKTEWVESEEAYGGVQESLQAASALADKLAVYGYRVFDGDGNTVYLPYTLLQCDILRESKRVVDYVRENNFTYGDAPINPAINHKAKKVSCDRLVCWVMYNVGFTDQPKTQGVVVSKMAAWCEKQGFEKIESKKQLQPGDIVLVNPDSNGVPGHTFIYGGTTDKKSEFYRYDCGSDTRIQSVQPFSEAILNFVCAYRPKR